MKKLVLNVAFPIVGTVLLAIFGSASIGLAAEFFAKLPTLQKPDHFSFLWAACGVLVFAIGEVVFLLSDRLSGARVATLIGRLTQIIGFVIALWASSDAMFRLNYLADPNLAVTPEGMATELSFSETWLAVGLWVVAIGQLVIAIGRLKGLNRAAYVSLGNRTGILKVVGTLSLVSLLLTLFAILALFAFATVFEIVFHQNFHLPPKEFEIAWLAQNFQGLTIYPYLAYWLFVFYCLVDGIYLLVAKLNSSPIGGGNLG